MKARTSVASPGVLLPHWVPPFLYRRSHGHLRYLRDLYTRVFTLASPDLKHQFVRNAKASTYHDARICRV
jgi:hypothetical protein